MVKEKKLDQKEKRSNNFVKILLTNGQADSRSRIVNSMVLMIFKRKHLLVKSNQSLLDASHLIDYYFYDQ